jgi:hypothetical protein
MSVIPSTAAVKIHAPFDCIIQSLPVLNKMHIKVSCKLFYTLYERLWGLQAAAVNSTQAKEVQNSFRPLNVTK